MSSRQRQLEVQERVRERREREDAAPLLCNCVPALISLSLEIEDHFGAATLARTRYVRHVVIERAPALFEIPCSDATCEAGGHDVTREVMQALLAGESEFSGEDVCFGYRGSERCSRVLRFAGHATYLRDASASKRKRDGIGP